jgi:hypothetical protein
MYKINHNALNITTVCSTHIKIQFIIHQRYITPHGGTNSVEMNLSKKHKIYELENKLYLALATLRLLEVQRSVTFSPYLNSHVMKTNAIKTESTENVTQHVVSD